MPKMKSAGGSSFERTVEQQFGVLPSFFRSAPEAPEVMNELWLFAKAAYIDNPIPAVFKERLFVYLSRFCENRYCVVRHCGFLIGHGRPSGDPDATPMTIDDVLTLLRRPFPTTEELDAVCTTLDALTAPMPAWPEPDTEFETALFLSASAVFLEPARSGRAREALRTALGMRHFHQLTTYLAFIRTAHFWTLTHPELQLEEDVEALLHDQEELARRLLDDPEAGRCEMGERLFDELLDLRREKDEVNALKRSEEQRSLLVAELSHRVKNTLATVQAIAARTATSKQSIDEFLQSFSERLQALGHTHSLLAESQWWGAGLEDILRGVLAPYYDRNGRTVSLDGQNLLLRPKAALTLGMVFHELATNAAKYGALSTEHGQVAITWDRADTPSGAQFRLQWRETGGPVVEPPTNSGFGRLLIERALKYELNGAAQMTFAADGLTCALNVPMGETTEERAGLAGLAATPPQNTAGGADLAKV